jgi:predicted ATPase
MPRYILTGTPRAGKTAVLRLLEFNGHVVVEEAATDVIVLENALGHEEPWNDRSFIDKIVTLQRRRQVCTQAPETATIFFDRSPLCTLALSRYLGFAPSRLLADEVERVMGESVYEATVFFIRNQGFIHATAARQIGFEDSLTFEQLHEQTYRNLGFQLVDVPPGPLADRVALVQQAVERLYNIDCAERTPLPR